MSENRTIKWLKDKNDEKVYDDILLSEQDLRQINSFLSGGEIFDKLHKLTEYRLAMELSKEKITIEEFKWAMAYWLYLKKYFAKTWQKD